MVLSAFYEHFVPTFIVASRLTGLFSFAPFFSHTAIPMKVRLAGVVMLSIIIHLGFSVGMDYQYTGGFNTLWDVIKEFATGAAMGLVVNLIFASISYAGAILAPQMGMAISQLVDPQTRQMQPLLSAFIALLGIMFFLAMDGHLMMIKAFYESYRILPIGGFNLNEAVVGHLLEALGAMYIIAFKLALPVLAVIIFLNVGMAIMARAVPQVNVIVVGFIITISVGMIVLSMVLPQMLNFLTETISSAISRMLWLLKAM